MREIKAIKTASTTMINPRATDVLVDRDDMPRLDTEDRVELEDGSIHYVARVEPPRFPSKQFKLRLRRA